MDPKDKDAGQNIDGFVSTSTTKGINATETLPVNVTMDKLDNWLNGLATRVNHSALEEQDRKSWWHLPVTFILALLIPLLTSKPRDDIPVTSGQWEGAIAFGLLISLLWFFRELFKRYRYLRDRNTTHEGHVLECFAMMHAGIAYRIFDDEIDGVRRGKRHSRNEQRALKKGERPGDANDNVVSENPESTSTQQKGELEHQGPIQTIDRILPRREFNILHDIAQSSQIEIPFEDLAHLQSLLSKGLISLSAPTVQIDSGDFIVRGSATDRGRKILGR